MKSRFEEVITTRERLRQIVGEPSHLVSFKVIDHIDSICERFIAASPYVIIGTRGADGLQDLSPKGDPTGFVHVVDRKTLAIPDRPGNNRIDTFENLLANPEVGLFFMIPGYGFTLRVSGRAMIVRDRALQDRFAVSGKPPDLIFAVAVEEAFMHCAKSMARAAIWKPERWPDTKDVPTLAEAMVEHGRLAEAKEEMQAIIEEDFSSRMY